MDCLRLSRAKRFPKYAQIVCGREESTVYLLCADVCCYALMACTHVQADMSLTRNGSITLWNKPFVEHPANFAIGSMFPCLVIENESKSANVLGPRPRALGGQQFKTSTL